MKYIIYGIGEWFIKNVDCFFDIIKDTIAFCDADNEKQKYRFLGIPVISPDSLFEYKEIVDRYYIAVSKYRQEIFKILTETYDIPAIKISILEVDDHLREMIRTEFQKFSRELKYKDYFNKSEAISPGALESCKVLASRNSALDFMPKNAICCEIGVGHGHFSEQILNILKPNKFYAIDNFGWLDRDNMTHRQWYENRFKNEIACGLVEICAGLSWDCLKEFRDNYFDYVYVDAGHSYDNVKKDVSVLINKIKDGGYIQFNDYIHFSFPEDQFYGVIQVVNNLINSGKHLVKYFCLERNNYNDIVIEIHK